MRGRGQKRRERQKEYEAVIDKEGKRRRRKQVPAQEALERLRNGESMGRLSNEYGVFFETLRSRLVESVGEEEYRAIIDKKWRKQVPSQEALTRLRSGESIKKLSKEYGVLKATLRRRLVKLIGEKEYRAIINEKAKRAMKQVPIREVLDRVRNGEPLAKLSKEYKLCRVTLRSILRKSIGKQQYSAIMDERRRVPVEKALRRFRSGEPLERLCREHGVGWRALRNRLIEAIGEEEFGRVVTKNRVIFSRNAGRRNRKQVPVQEILERVKSGESLKKLSKEYGVSNITLRRRLMGSLGEERYKAMRKRITVKCVRVRPRRVSEGYGSPLARQNGADSLIELEVRTLLRNHRVHFKYREILEVNGHCYEPDFMFGDRAILEVMGVNQIKYWKRCDKKIRDYLERDYRVFAVIPDCLINMSSKYIPRGVSVIKYSDFKKNIEKHVRTLKASNTTINKPTIPLMNSNPHITTQSSQPNSVTMDSVKKEFERPFSFHPISSDSHHRMMLAEDWCNQEGLDR